MAKFIVLHGIKIEKSPTVRIAGRIKTIGPAFRLEKKTYQVGVCSCGTCKVFLVDNLQRGTESCGCLQKEKARLNATHGLTGTEIAKTYKRMKERCSDPKHRAYRFYGALGVSVCERWLGPNGLANFAEDMGDRPSSKHSIDRIDSCLDYSPENCRWATWEEQARNRKSNHLITFRGKTQCLQAWADSLGIAHTTLLSRVRRLGSEKALLTTEGKQ